MPMDAPLPSGEPPLGMAPGTACPPAAAWERLAAGTARAEEEERLLGHLEGCDACAALLAAIPDRFLPAGFDGTRTTPPDERTRRIVESLAAEEPARERTAPRPPEIAGLVDVVEVGQGGMGTVYRARDERLGRTVAVKVLSGSAALSPDGHIRADREARILTRIAHPNIVQIFFVTESHGAPAIVMEWIDGERLEERGTDGALSSREAAGLVAALARAVSAVHACGIVHRDITPSNVLLERHATALVPKLIDFGLARPDADGPALTRTSVALGTPSFMAPEQTGLDPALGAVGPATDIHGLGALLYWLLCGSAPYDAPSTGAALKRAAAGNAPSLSKASRTVPRDLRTIVEKCMAQRPERRYRSADALADDLERFLALRPIHARRAGAGERIAKWARRRPAVAALAASVIAATIALVVVSTHYVRGLEQANLAITQSNDEAVRAAGLARMSFASLTDFAAERLLARGSALDEGDHDHLRRILEQYRDWPLEPDAASALRFRAAGLDRLSKILLRLSWPDDCLEAVGIAVESLEALEARGLSGPDDDRLRNDLDLFRSSLLVGLGRIDEAAASATACVARLEADRDARPALARHLPGALSNLAVVQSRQGDADAATRSFRRAVEECDALLAAAPDAEMLRIALPVYFNVANAATRASLEERYAIQEKVVALAEEGLARYDTDREAFASTALMGLATLADIDLAEGRPEAALGKVRRRAALAAGLAAELPGAEVVTSTAFFAANQASRCLRALGRTEEAEEELDAAVALAEQALAAEPAVVSRARSVAWLLDAKAELEESLGRPEGAIAAYRRLLDVSLPWVSGPAADTPLTERADAARHSIERLEAGSDR